MIIFFSGGSEIAEVYLKNPTIMQSFFTDVSQKGKPDSRLLGILRARRKSRKEQAKRSK